MQLTKAEEQIMQIIWELGEGLVKDIRDRFSDPKPARNTVSTVVRVLEKKGFVGHKAYGNVFVYHPLVSKGNTPKASFLDLWRVISTTRSLQWHHFLQRNQISPSGSLRNCLRIRKMNCEKLKK